MSSLFIPNNCKQTFPSLSKQCKKVFLAEMSQLRLDLKLEFVRNFYSKHTIKPPRFLPGAQFSFNKMSSHQQPGVKDFLWVVTFTNWSGKPIFKRHPQESFKSKFGIRRIKIGYLFGII